MNNYVFFIDKEKDLLSQEIFALMRSAGANFHELESQLRYGASHLYLFGFIAQQKNETGYYRSKSAKN